MKAIERDQAIEAVVDALTLALPYVEDAEKDPCYRKGAVKRMTNQIRAALSQWDAVALQGLDSSVLAGENDKVRSSLPCSSGALV